MAAGLVRRGSRLGRTHVDTVRAGVVGQSPLRRRVYRRGVDPHAASGDDPRALIAPVLRAPLTTGFLSAAGALAAYTLVLAIAAVRDVLVLVLVAAFLAVGLHPAVVFLRRRGLSRPVAVAAVLVGLVLLVAGAVATFVPAVVTEVTRLVDEAPRLVGDLRRIPALHQLDVRYHLVAKGQQRITDLLRNHPERLVGGALGLGRALLGLLGSVVAVLALTAYFVVESPSITRNLYRLVPRSRRARVILLTEKIGGLVGGYVLGKLVTAVLAGLFQLVVLLVLHVPHAVALGLLTALLSLIPLVGGYAAGAACAVVALTVSVPATIAVVSLFTGYRLVEDYLITPRIMRQSVDISPVLTIVAVILGGAVLGLVGALLAIPTAAALQLVGREVLIRRLDTR